MTEREPEPGGHWKKPVIPDQFLSRIRDVVLPLAVVLNMRGTDPIMVVLPLHLAASFLIALVCHSELARDRPPARRLAEFYLLLSLGGVLGGALNTLLAPMVFKSYPEYPIVITLACLLLPGPLSDRK